jgi:imidazolonepropionase
MGRIATDTLSCCERCYDPSIVQHSMNSEALSLWHNVRIATCDAGMRVIEKGALAVRNGRIAWLGEAHDAPSEVSSPDIKRYDLGGAWITPGLIDCHTHLIFAGTRAEEYAERLRGVSYTEIATRGGGILTTVRATRAASEQQLIDAAAPRLAALLGEGVTTVEIKSGYGLTLHDEAKMLRVARKLGAQFPVTIKTTLLAAHTLPPEFDSRADAYIDTIAREWLPALNAEGLVDAVDVFCERIAFDTNQVERLFAAASKLGLPVKMHAEQLTNMGGTRLGARHGALSCDHLEYAGAAEAEALAAAGTVAVLLPVAFYGLADTHKPPIAALRSAGAAIAIATDCNPGSAPGASLQLAMSMATRLFALTQQEALAGVTRHAARALGLQSERGILAPGFAADFAVWGIDSIEELGYWAGYNPCRAVVQAGELVRGALSPSGRGI